VVMTNLIGDVSDEELIRRQFGAWLMTQARKRKNIWAQPTLWPENLAWVVREPGFFRPNWRPGAPLHF